MAQHELVLVDGAGHNFVEDSEQAVVMKALTRYAQPVAFTAERDRSGGDA